MKMGHLYLDHEILLVTEMMLFGLLNYPVLLDLVAGPVLYLFYVFMVEGWCTMGPGDKLKGGYKYGIGSSNVFGEKAPLDHSRFVNCGRQGGR